MGGKGPPSAGALASAVLEALRSGEDPLVLGRVYEAALGEVGRNGAAAERKQRGTYLTPRWLVDRVLDLTLEPLIRDAGEDKVLSLRVLDPACGSGEFLVASAERLAKRLSALRGGGTRRYRAALRWVCASRVHGVDRDAVAVALCRGALERLAGAGPGIGSGVVSGDGLLDDLPEVDVVVGNPPYLNRLERSTWRDRAEAAVLRERFGEAAMAYTDVAWLFLLRAVQTVRPGGRVGLVLPQSVLGARDAAGVRSAVALRASMTDLWLADSLVFGANVHVCAPALEVGGRSRMVRRWLGRSSSRLPDAAWVCGDGSWASLGAVGVPDVVIEGTGSLSDVADITADFRDQYYGLTGRIVQRRGGSAESLAPLVTTGMLEVGRCAWGERPCRFAGRTWAEPRVDLQRLPADMAAWAAQRRRPKILLATQTRVLEAAVDERGEWLPVTPIISILPRPGMEVWTLGAVLCSPVLSAIAARVSAGTGLSREVIKLSARQVRALPMPRRGCDEAGDLLRAAAANGPDRDALLDRGARLVCRAYGLSDAATDELVRWWWDRQRGRGSKSKDAVMSNRRRSG